ncbi:hypothetical protein FACS1894204_00350 [Synergistales bacterium]|nr:hypothetical protein FACS1894204_00350 [Synergistales bacterium]
MKRIVKLSLFWKIYLTMVFVLFLPMILFTLTHLIRDWNGNELRGIGMIQALNWSASLLAEQAESTPDELTPAWLAEVKNASGLDLCVERDGAVFIRPAQIGSDFTNRQTRAGRISR